MSEIASDTHDEPEQDGVLFYAERESRRGTTEFLWWEGENFSDEYLHCPARLIHSYSPPQIVWAEIEKVREIVGISDGIHPRDHLFQRGWKLAEDRTETSVCQPESDEQVRTNPYQEMRNELDAYDGSVQTLPLQISSWLTLLFDVIQTKIENTQNQRLTETFTDEEIEAIKTETESMFRDSKLVLEVGSVDFLAPADWLRLVETYRPLLEDALHEKEELWATSDPKKKVIRLCHVYRRTET